ncbi:carbohydrate kinase [Plasmodium gonderi]|uniref:ATP-dependent (S)-NAD(P)H-hydrate dehydratase n=1 Tax=Plasmodium gonderi TaxID=77519 RepID=A0A1Y1JF97_PLAGO|nr:carbohydrate kinase [Plasmodium gonderi]GAW81201.1 carbohydrate kinase [Plasmodium gonderi]
MEEYSVSENLKLDHMHLNRKLLNKTLYELQWYVVPELSEKDHKGSMGKICIVGGSEIYSGAPFLSAMSTLRLGADLCFVITSEGSAIPIKCYSPELIVYPYLHNRKSKINNIQDGELGNCIEYLMNRIDCCVIGPGLGTIDDCVTKACLIYIIKNFIKKNIFLILDADIIQFVLTNEDIFCQIKNYEHCIFTPNHNEYRKMISYFTPNENVQFDQLTSDQIIIHAHNMMRIFNGPKILIKGFYDIFISKHFFFVSFIHPPCLKRPGGLGDILTGVLAVFLTWGMKKKNIFSLTLKEMLHMENVNEQNECLDILSSFCGSFFLKYVCKEEFKNYHRGLIASDIIKRIPYHFHILYDTIK